MRRIEPHTNYTIWTKDCQPLEKGAGDKLGIAGAIIAYTGRALARLDNRRAYLADRRIAFTRTRKAVLKICAFLPSPNYDTQRTQG
ncbi:hypothetical protein L249_0892 [Ophiocordyceps polyrhachis-furcata BCC 54312]|uniref:Uncharacterized protein n=1 Tax=Ophiocordyceps polyrhachis-furcata BCC 54312 TaxID=1330021 RepID=A0A367LEE8_9HYPO|nr:hypothetical protein L249_0892 [Ophiocordyceps polyrhachis-furcata BCC 54312]